MINAVSNYEKMKLSMANVFLQYDQDTMIAKFSVTCSHHLNLTDFEVGASCSIALQGKAKTGYPRVSRGSFLSDYRFFYVPLRTLFIYLFSFFQDIDSCIHIPIHPVSTFTYVCPF